MLSSDFSLRNAVSHKSPERRSATVDDVGLLVFVLCICLVHKSARCQFVTFANQSELKALWPAMRGSNVVVQTHTCRHSETVYRLVNYLPCHLTTVPHVSLW